MNITDIKLARNGECEYKAFKRLWAIAFSVMIHNAEISLRGNNNGQYFFRASCRFMNSYFGEKYFLNSFVGHGIIRHAPEIGEGMYELCFPEHVLFNYNVAKNICEGVLFERKRTVYIRKLYKLLKPLYLSQKP